MLILKTSKRRPGMVAKVREARSDFDTLCTILLEFPARPGSPIILTDTYLYQDV